MTLRAKLLLAQLPLALSLLVVGTVSRRTLIALDRNTQNVLKDNYASVLAAQHMRNAVDELGRLALLHASGQTMDGARVQALSAVFERELKFQESNITEAGEREITEKLRASWTDFATKLKTVLAAPLEQSSRVYFAELLPSLSAVERATDEVLAVNQDAMIRKSELARRSAASMSAVTIEVTVAAFLLGVFASGILTTRLVRPLGILSRVVRRIGEGDLAARARLAGRDEIAQVAREVNTMVDRLSEYRSSSLGELLQAQQAAQSAIDSLPDPVLILGLDGRPLNLNRAAEELFGISIGVDPDAALSAAGDGVREVVARMRDHVGSGKGAYTPKGLEEAVALTTKEGVRFFLARANPVRGEGDALAGFTVLFQDVTRLRRFDELKNDLVATVAHEFRTPLTSLRMAIHLCAEGVVGPVTAKQAELLFAAREDCERLQGIVDDLLDLSRIQAGRIDLHLRAVSADSMLEQALAAHEVAARERGITLEKNPLTIDRAVLADPDRIELVFSNLVGNALRHTPAGGQVRLRAAPHDDHVRFEVSDTGVGIAAEHLPRLFERFYRVPGAPEGGAGLGLYIAKEIVDAHQGQMGVESEPGHGSVFWFTLPLAPPTTDLTA